MCYRLLSVLLGISASGMLIIFDHLYIKYFSIDIKSEENKIFVKRSIVAYFKQISICSMINIVFYVISFICTKIIVWILFFAKLFREARVLSFGNHFGVL